MNESRVKLAVVLGSLVSVICLYFVFGFQGRVFAEPAIDHLLSEGKQTLASSEQKKYEAHLAVDGKSDTRWTAQTGSYPQWWQVDLGAVHFVSRVEADWYKGDKWSYRYLIESSFDGKTFRQIADRSLNSQPGNTTDAVLTAARYIRVKVVGTSTPDGSGQEEGRASAYAFRVYGANVPTDNPVATQYGTDEFAWTEEIQWENVKHVAFFPGATDMEKYVAARNAAAADGGGVVYFPAGVYSFDDHLYLTDGVVIRGDASVQGNARQSGFVPLTRLEFPKYVPVLEGAGGDNSKAFKKIYTLTPNTDSNIGLVHVDINRGAVSLQGHPDLGTNRNTVVFGIRSNNVAEADPAVPESYQHPWQRFSYRFAANIKIHVLENALVANNRLNDATTDDYEQPGYIIKKGNGYAALEGSQAVFSYTDHYGIYVNRGNSGTRVTPETAPNIFRRGIVIRDNWIYHTMRVAIHAAGDGLNIQNNTIRDKQDKVAWINPTGTKQSEGNNTFENRGIDWSGSNVTIEGNDFEVYSHRIGWAPQFKSTDGEGILHQECCGGSVIDGIRIANNKGNAYIGLYKSADIRNAWIVGNELASASSAQLGTKLIYVNANTNNANYSADNVHIRDNRVSGTIYVTANTGITNVSIAGNTVASEIEVAGGPLGENANIQILNNNNTNAGHMKLTPSVQALGLDSVGALSGNIGFVPTPISTPITVTGVTYRSVFISFEDVGLFGVQPTGYAIERLVNAEWLPMQASVTAMQAGSSVMLELQELTPNTSYEFRLRPYNEYGYANASSAYWFKTTAEGTNRPAVVSITRITDSKDNVFTNNEKLTVEASASDPDGKVTTVMFFRNHEKIGEVTKEPYRITPKSGWKAGQYEVVAIAIDSNGEASTSESVFVTVLP